MRLIVPYPACGLTDVVARIMGQKAASLLGQPVGGGRSPRCQHEDRNPEEQTMSSGTLVEVSRLAGKDFMVEIEVFAAIDEK